MQQKKYEEIQDFHVIGISYEKADVDTRGNFAFFDEWIQPFAELAKQNGFEHFFILSTCNRTEIYFFGDSSEKMMELYCQQVNGDLEVFKNITFVKKGMDALEHLFRVSSGLESQILGDFEVLGQMRKAFKKFKAVGCSNPYLERFIDTAIKISKQIKNETSLSDGATSVSYAAVQYITQNIPNFKDKRIVLFGTGKIGRNTCENLVKHSNQNQITLVNRSPDKAQDLSEKFNVKWQAVENLQDILTQAEILIVATGAPQPTVTKDLVLPTDELTIIDLSIPENVADEVSEVEGVRVINVDELSKITQATMNNRLEEVPKVETIIRLNMWEFEEWLEQRQYVPAIEAFKGRMEFLKQHEKRQLAKKEVHINGNEPLSDRLIKKMTNQFAAHIMQNPDKAEEIIGLMNSMFHLDLDSE